MNISERIMSPAGFPAIVELLDRLKPGGRETVLLDGLQESGVDYLLFLLSAKLDRDFVVILDDRQRSRKLQRNLRTLALITGRGNTVFTILPFLDVEAYSRSEPHPQVIVDRMRSLYSLAVNEDRKVIIAPSQSLLFPVPPRDGVKNCGMRIDLGAEIMREDILYHLESSGFMRRGITTEAGEYSVRGGITDIFSPLYRAPVRIEFDGDIINSLRFFDPSNQISIEETDRLDIIPVSELSLSGKESMDETYERTSFFQYSRLFPDKETVFDYANDPVIFHFDTITEEAEMDGMREHFALRHKAALGDDIEYDTPDKILLSRGEWERRKNNAANVFIGSSGRTVLDSKHRISIPGIYTASSSINREEGLKEIIRASSDSEYVVIFAGDRGKGIALYENETLSRKRPLYLEIEETRDAERFNIPEFAAFDRDKNSDLLNIKLNNRPVIIPLEFYGGFRFEEIGLRIIGSEFLLADFTGAKRARKKRAYSFSLQDLKEGDYIIHHDHGLGLYRGLTRIEREGTPREFLDLEYDGDEHLFLPVERLDLVDRYIVMEGITPTLDRLGSPKWINKKRKVQKSVEDLARMLLNLYASRQLIKGYKYQADTEEQKKLDESFPYVETEDQKAAIEEVRADLESDKPMDRLIVGDVGFGKTEVALRAAFKVAMEGKQTAILAPTTILALQHFRNFSERLSEFSVNVGMLSRLVPASEQKRVFKEIEDGKIDILIGTHRLLSKDLKFKNLGLLVVDEEQRFGVKHKEKLKALKHQTDVLTLTATPIPRTLYLSIAGIRDLSLIETPPAKRMSVKTEIISFDEEIIREALTREMKRGGQVYFVHNRVATLENIKARIAAIVPEAKIALAHGQMRERELEKIILSFINNEVDILLSTTIVENGLDIPNVNTLIVNKAHHFGLAQLYQLRGRVGRSARQAYCYLIVPPFASLTPVARKRLSTLIEFSQLGAGYRIAGIDMEIRGSGNILGSEQTGRIAQVGFDLYTKMLEEAVSQLKGDVDAAVKETQASIELQADIVISANYIPDTSQRLGLYRRTASARSREQLDNLAKEIEDRYGKLTKGVINLIDYGKLRIMANSCGISKITYGSKQVVIRVEKDTSLDPENIYTLIGEWQDARFMPDGRLVLPCGGRREALSIAKRAMKKLYGNSQ